jgi:glycosyltransferase involved in cell wall biosynthesis
MKISIVTISYNQSKFLEQAICSVVNQDYPDIEYIVVDPGSTDGSREIIEKYQDQIDKIVFEPDEGPADGLNKGFSYATGEIFGFINADDYLIPGAINKVVKAFRTNRRKDVLSGNVFIIDQQGILLRRFYSRKFTPIRAVYGAASIAQQGTFFRSQCFKKAGGFNKSNRVAWDGEIWIEMALNGAQFGLIDDFIAAFRIYPDTVSLSQTSSIKYNEYKDKIFHRVLNRNYKASDRVLRYAYKALEYIENPRQLIERLRYGHALSLEN